MDNNDRYGIRVIRLLTSKLYLAYPTKEYKELLKAQEMKNFTSSYDRFVQ